MKPLSFAVRSALTLYTLPFLLGGILLAGVPYSWLYDSLTGNWRLLLVPSLLILFLGCMFLGGLVAYGLLIVTLLWVAPNSPLLVKAEVENPSWSLRLAGPAFARVRAIAELFAPTRN
ncbi:MAG: hypothetical protein U1F54_14620 [Burkholderiales bacterium]